MNEEEIQTYLDKKINTLKPEIRKRFEYQFGDEDNNVLGYTRLAFKPPLIVFNTPTIMKAPDLSYKLLDELINHEILHSFYGVSHDEIRCRQKSINFFK